MISTNADLFLNGNESFVLENVPLGTISDKPPPVTNPEDNHPTEQIDFPRFNYASKNNCRCTAKKEWTDYYGIDSLTVLWAHCGNKKEASIDERQRKQCSFVILVEYLEGVSGRFLYLVTATLEFLFCDTKNLLNNRESPSINYGQKLQNVQKDQKPVRASFFLAFL